MSYNARVNARMPLRRMNALSSPPAPYKRMNAITGSTNSTKTSDFAAGFIGLLCLVIGSVLFAYGITPGLAGLCIGLAIMLFLTTSVGRAVASPVAAVVFR